MVVAKTGPSGNIHRHTNFPNTHEPHRHHTLSAGDVPRPTMEPHGQHGGNGRVFPKHQVPVSKNIRRQQVNFLADFKPS